MRTLILCVLTLGPAVAAGAHTTESTHGALLAIAHQLVALHHLPITLFAVAVGVLAAAALHDRRSR